MALRCTASAVWSTRVPAETVPAKGAVDARIRVAAYDGDEVYKLRGFVGYQIDLEFEPGETFTGLGAGDMEGLSFVGQDNHLFLKPKAAKVATNLTVLTSRRHYQFDYMALVATTGGGRPGRHLCVAIHLCTDAVANPRPRPRQSGSIRNWTTHRPSGRRTSTIGIAASLPFKPVAASDDGVHTRLRFAANAELPAIFVRNEDGSESLLNFSMDAGDVIIHRVAQRFILRRGKLTGCVVNQGFAGGGTRLESGTVAPDVERRVQGGVP